MSTSGVSIDYLSFSVDLVNRVDELFTARSVVADATRELIGASLFEEAFLHNDGWKSVNGQRPYAYGEANAQIGVHIWYGGHSNALIQFSGSGCKWLERGDHMLPLLAAVKERLTRLDIAIDIETNVSPIEFAQAGYNNRIKTYGQQQSPSGDTCYIGSRTSQKFCRVYRYKSPHPRSHLLRVEYETKKAQAKIAAGYILGYGLEYAADSLTKYYDWSHEVMPMQHELVEKMQSEVTTRSDAKTLTWILTQVAPAIKKLIENGTIENPEQFFDKHFMPEHRQQAMFDMTLKGGE